MATEAPKSCDNCKKSCDCGWLWVRLLATASYKKFKEDLKRLEEEKDHIKALLRKSSGSWAQKEQTMEEDIIMALEEVANNQEDEEIG